MFNRSMKHSSNALKAGVAAAVLGLAVPHAIPQARAQSAADQVQGMTEQHSVLDEKVMAALQECQRISSSCADSTQNAAGILVFPGVIKADLIIGGEGGRGALIENGKITGYYSIGAGTAGLEAGIDKASQVYVFRTPEALSKLTSGSEWRVGATAGVTVVKADAHAGATSGDILTYIFDSKGLHGGVAVDVMDVWKTGQRRPQWRAGA